MSWPKIHVATKMDAETQTSLKKTSGVCCHIHVWKLPRGPLYKISSGVTLWNVETQPRSSDSGQSSLHHRPLHLPIWWSGQKHKMWTWHERFCRLVNTGPNLWQQMIATLKFVVNTLSWRMGNGKHSLLANACILFVLAFTQPPNVFLELRLFTSETYKLSNTSVCSVTHS